MGRVVTGVSRILRLVLILLIAYFSQVYPYLHVHHSHSESESPIELSMHPIDVKLRHVAEQHDHDCRTEEQRNGHQHHEEFEGHIDWHMVRTQSNSVPANLDLAYISVKLNALPTADESGSLYRIDPASFLKSVPIDGIKSRGPPIIR